MHYLKFLVNYIKNLLNYKKQCIIVVVNPKRGKRYMAESDIVLSGKRKVNIFDRVIQTVVIMVNMNKMNKAIDEHLNTIHKLENDEQKDYHQNILREVVFVKYQYDIVQRQMYELKLNYADEVVDIINSTDKIERLKLQKLFLELEYDRVTKSKFRSKEDIKYHLLILSSVIEEVKQNIKDEGKNQRYNELVRVATEIDTKIQTEQYKEEDYKEMFEIIDEYVSYINDNYDIARLPSDERELIEFVIETMITGIQSDIDRHTYEYKLLINICKNSYRYFKILDKIFEKIINIYNESLLSNIMSVTDYIKAYKEIYDMKIKTMVNDVHRNIKVEDEYLEYSKLLANSMDEELEIFLIKSAAELPYQPADVKDMLMSKCSKEDENEEAVAGVDNAEESKEEVKEDAKTDVKDEETINKLVDMKLSSILGKDSKKEEKDKSDDKKDDDPDDEGEIVTLDKIVKNFRRGAAKSSDTEHEDSNKESDKKEKEEKKLSVKRRTRVASTSKK